MRVTIVTETRHIEEPFFDFGAGTLVVLFALGALVAVAAVFTI